MPDKPKYSAPAVNKTLSIIELMVSNNKPYTVTELSNITENSVNSIFRIMIELENKHYVKKNPIDSSYELTSKLYFLGNSLKNRVDLIEETKATLTKIKNITKETIILTQLDSNNKTIIINQLESPLPIKFLSTIGLAYDSYCSAMGKCLLAFSDKDRISEYLNNTELTPHTQTTITDKNDFYLELEHIRERGISFDNEESVQGLTCVACPIFSSNNRLVASIGISAISFRVSPLVLDKFAKTLYTECKLLSEKLGCIEYPNSNKTF